MDTAKLSHFIGYCTLEDWLEAIDARRPVFVLKIMESVSDQGSLSIAALVVVCQQIDPTGMVHYCRLQAATLTRCFGKPFDSDWKDREACWQSLHDTVEQDLRARQVMVVPSTVAPPRDLRLLDGRSKRIRFDLETRRFRIDAA